MRNKISPKMILHEYKRRIISEASASTDYFVAAYLLKENIIGKRINIHVLFVYEKEMDTFEFVDEVCFSIFDWVEERREEWFISLYEEGYDFDLTLYPHYISEEEISKLEKDVRMLLEKNRLT